MRQKSIKLLYQIYSKDRNCLSKRRTFILLAGCFSGLPLNPLLFLDLTLDGLDVVGWFYVKRDSFPSEGLDKYLVTHDILYNNIKSSQNTEHGRKKLKYQLARRLMTTTTITICSIQVI